MKNISFNEAINYLKDGEIILTRNRTSFYLDNGSVTVHTPNSRLCGDARVWYTSRRQRRWRENHLRR